MAAIGGRVEADIAAAAGRAALSNERSARASAPKSPSKPRSSIYRTIGRSVSWSSVKSVARLRRSSVATSMSASGKPCFCTSLMQAATVADLPVPRAPQSRMSCAAWPCARRRVFSRQAVSSGRRYRSAAHSRLVQNRRSARDAGRPSDRPDRRRDRSLRAAAARCAPAYRRCGPAASVDRRSWPCP